MYYSGKNDIFGTWSTNITYADLLNIFEAKQIVRKYKFKKGYKRLRKKEIVKRIKRQHYIFNPDFFIPYLYDKEKRIFDSAS